MPGDAYTWEEVADRIAAIYRDVATIISCPACEAPVGVECDGDAPHLARVAAVQEMR